MYKQRKKVVCNSKEKGNIIVIDSDTDQAERQPEIQNVKIQRKNNKKEVNKVINVYDTIPEIPTIELSKQDMLRDPIVLMMKLQQKYREFGAIKIKACPEWQPPLCFKYTEKGITTRIQKIHRLSQGKAFHQKYQEYNIRTFTHMAEHFQKNYKYKFPQEGISKESQLENEYWKLVKGVPSENPKEAEKYKVTIEYAADLPVHQYGSGFPLHESMKTSDQHFNYATSNFNLNNMYKSDSSILKISEKNNEKISGITIPWVYMGMMFSTFCWHVEDLWLNSLNYSHKGAIKTWYVIPESDKEKFDAYILQKTGKRQFLNSITFMVDPAELIDRGISVHKAYQRPREYILTCFGAYHAGFSQGWNVGEAVNIGTTDSFQAIKKAMCAALQFKNHKPPVICYDWLISGNVTNQSVNLQFIKREYSKITTAEFAHVKRALGKFTIESIDELDGTEKYDKMSCYTCRHYQYLSALKCASCLRKYCLEHADRCCGKKMIFMTREPDASRKKVFDLVQKTIK